MDLMVRRLKLSGGRLAIALSFASLIWTTALITNLSFELIGPEKLGMLFNDMAVRLLHLDFTVSPEAISFEAFVREGRTYTYFGIFPALVRMPAVLFGMAAYPLGRISCILALWCVTFATIRMTQAAIGSEPEARSSRRLALASLVGASFSGPGIYVLASAAAYHEAIFWAAAWTSIFNWIVVRRIRGAQALLSRDYIGLAIVAGLALLSRLTCGVALYAGLALLLIWPIAITWTTQGMREALGLAWPMLKTAMPGIFIAIWFVLIEAGINYGRWGNPLTVYPFQYYHVIQASPHHNERLANLQTYGLFSPVRTILSTIYYLSGINIASIFPDTSKTYYDVIEGPRSSILFCMPWVFVCSGLGFGAAWSNAYRGGAATLSSGQWYGSILLLKCSIFDLAVYV